LSSRLSKADFDTKLPDARAALIDQITAARLAELDPANLPADVAANLVAILTRLSKADFDTKLPDARAALIDQITAARMAQLDPANMPTSLATLLSRLGDPSPSNIATLLALVLYWSPNTGFATMDGSEITLAERKRSTEGINIAEQCEGYVDLSPMQVGDTIVIKEYKAVQNEATYNLYATHTYSGVQAEPVVHFTSKMLDRAWKVTIQQTAGTNRTLYYYFESTGR